MRVSEEVEKIVDMTVVLAKNADFVYVVPELMLYAICQNEVFAQAFENCGGSVRELDYHLRTYLENYMEYKSEADQSEPQLSLDMQSVLESVREVAQNSGKDVVELPHILFALYGLEESYAVYYMLTQGVERNELLQEMNILYEEIAWGGSAGKSDSRTGRSDKGSGKRSRTNGNEEEGYDEISGMTDGEPEEDEGSEQGRGRKQSRGWQQYVVCLNDMVDQTNPLIGRRKSWSGPCRFSAARRKTTLST